MNNIKSVIGEIIVVIILVGLLIFSYVLFNKKDDKPQTKEENTVYAIVKGKDNDKVLIENIDNKEKIYILKDMEVKAGDIIVIKYINDINECDYEIIGDSNEYTEKTSEVINTVSKNTTTESTTTTTTKKVTNNVTSTTSKKVSADDVIQTVKEKSEQAIEYTKDEKNKGKVKETFIQFVDFIFYGGQIKGYTFDELSDAGKAKVIYYTLKVDGSIDEKWPDYKEKISDKTKDIKAKLIAKYMEFTTKVCTKYPEQCTGLKEDWNEVKTRFKYSWDVIKDAFNKYAKPKGLEAIEKLKEWYEIFSGKKE